MTPEWDPSAGGWDPSAGGWDPSAGCSVMFNVAEWSQLYRKCGSSCRIS